MSSSARRLCVGLFELTIRSAIFNDPERASREFPVPVLQCLQVKTLDSKTPGAAPDRFMTHLALVEVDHEGTSATWGEHVTDEEYNAAPAS